VEISEESSFIAVPGPSQASTDDRQADSPRAENLRSESTGAKVRAEAQSSRQDSLVPFTQYLRNLGLSACASSRKESQLAKNPRMPIFSRMEEVHDLTGTQCHGHPLRHPQRGA
jgi:hypothetical protein